MTLGESIRKGAKWLLFGSLGGTAIGFAIGILLARLLTPADFGLIVTVQIFTGVLSLVASGGMGQALVREKDVEAQDLHAVFTLQLLIGAAIYAGFFIAAPFIAQAFGNPIYVSLIRVSTITFLLRPFLNIPSASLSRDMRFKALSIIGMITGIIGGSASILMAWGGWGVWSLVLSGLLGSLLSIGALSWRSGYRPRILLDPKRWRRFTSYGFKTSANDLIIYARNQAANSVVSHNLGAAAVGTYNKGDSLASIPYSTVSASLYDVLFRGLSTVQDDLVETKRLYLRSVCLLIAYTLPIYAGMIWLANPFIRGVFGEHWASAAVPMAILAASGLFTCLNNQTGAVLAAQNMLGRELIVQITFMVVMLIGVVLGLRWGLAGVATGVLIARAIAVAQMCRLLATRLPLSWSDYGGALTPGLVLSTASFLGLWAIDAALPKDLAASHPLVYLLICAPVGSLAFVLALLFLPIQQLAGETARWKRVLRLERA